MVFLVSETYCIEYQSLLLDLKHFIIFIPVFAKFYVTWNVFSKISFEIHIIKINLDGKLAI